MSEYKIVQFDNVDNAIIDYASLQGFHGFILGLGVIAIRRPINFVLEHSITYIFTGELPKIRLGWMTNIFPALNKARHLMITERNEQERLFIRQQEKSEEIETYREVRKNQQQIAKKSDFADKSIIRNIVEILLDKKNADNSHLMIIGKTGSGKDIMLRAFMNMYKELCPNIKFLIIDPKYKANNFEYDYVPHFRGIEQAAIGVNQAYTLMNNRLKSNTFNSDTSETIVVIVNELHMVCDLYPEAAKQINILINVMRGANMVLVCNTQTYNAGEHNLSAPAFNSFIKVVIGGIQEDFVSTKLTYLSKPFVSNLKSQVMAYTQANKYCATVNPAKGHTYVTLIPKLKHAYEEIDAPFQPMRIEELELDLSHDDEFVSDEPKVGDFETDKGDEWMVQNHLKGLKRDAAYIGQTKASALFKVGVETYRTRLNKLLAKEMPDD